MLQKILILSKKIRIIPFLYEKVYLPLKNSQSNFYFDQRVSLE